MSKHMARGSLLVLVLTGVDGLHRLRVNMAAVLLSYVMVAVSWVPLADKIEPHGGVASLLFSLTLLFTMASFAGLVVGHMAAVLWLLSFILILALFGCLHEPSMV